MNFEHGTHGPFRLGTRGSALSVASLLVLALAATPSAGQAQSVQPVSPGAMVMSKSQAPTMTSAVLINATIVDDTASQAHIVLNFNTHAPAFSVIKADGDHPALAFVSTTRGNSVRVQPNGKGLMRSITFEQQSSIMVVRLETNTTVTMSAAPSGDQTVTITVSSDHPVTDTTSAGSLPRPEQRAPGEDGFEVVPLKYADISEVVGLLTDGQSVKSNDIFIPSEPAFGSAGVSGNPNTPQPQQNPQPLDQALAQSVDGAIGVDRRLNAIILKGSPATIARLKQKIAEIDVPVQSVVLETMFVELDESGATDVGLNFNNTNNQIGVATFQSGAYAPSGTVVGKGVASVSFQAALYGQVMKGHGRIVSKPRIAAQSGSTAKIITGDALPILTSIALSGVNAVSQQVQYVNVGVTLQIAPRVSVNGFVTSHVFCVVSSVTGTSQGYPTISQREAETSATVRDGETFVIGGLTVDSDLSTNNKVPGLGDLPVLGGLFKVRNGTRSKTDLYIVVTPTIIKRGDLGLASASASTLQAREEPTIAPAALAPPAQAALSAPMAPADPSPPMAATSADRAASPAVATPAPPPVTRAAAPRSHATGLVWVQVGAFPAADLAQKVLSETAAALPDQLAGKPRKVEATSKDGKAFYRASFGGFASRADAAAFCETMKGLGKACFVSNRRERATTLRDLNIRPALSARAS